MTSLGLEDYQLEDDEELGLTEALQRVSDVRHDGPFPNVHDLFMHYNARYFEDKLGFCSVEWSSKRMTLCAGVCMYRPGGGCVIRLSEPLLKLRPVVDLKETLLHEMIHAYMFLEGIRDREDHGPKFQAKMREINASRAPDPERPPQGYNITVYHTMSDEVDLYRVHWWRCERCGGIVKRAMNRPPQPADCRGRTGQRGDACVDPCCAYHTHLRGCGGAYVKVKGPDLEGGETGGKGKRVRAGGGGGSSTGGGSGGGGSVSVKAAPGGSRQITEFFSRLPGGGQKLGGDIKEEPGQHLGLPHHGRDGDVPGPGPGPAAAPPDDTTEARRQRCAVAAQRRAGVLGQAPPAGPRVVQVQLNEATEGLSSGGLQCGGVHVQQRQHQRENLFQNAEASDDEVVIVHSVPGVRPLPPPTPPVVRLDDDDDLGQGNASSGGGGHVALGELERGGWAATHTPSPALACPMCMATFASLADLNGHLDTCLLRC